MDARYALFIIVIAHGCMAKTLPVSEQMLEDMSTKEVALARVDTWIDGLGAEGLVLQETGVFLQVPNSHIYHYERSVSEDDLPEFSVNIIFNQQVKRGMTLDDVRKSFKRIALSRFPTPGLGEGLKEFWSVTPKLPVSSFTEGVNVSSYNDIDGTMSLTVEAEFFAVLGERKGHLEIADVPLADDDYFQIRRPFGLSLTLDAQFPEPLTLE